MSTEIERKFLVIDDSYKKDSYEALHIIQGYICRMSGRTVRIRISNDKAYITIKGRSTDNGLSRYEWEKEISSEDALDLLKLCTDGIIDKTRYKVRSGEHVFEVDEFYGRNTGLVMAEVELRTVDDKVVFPDFIGREVTGDGRYYNSNLLVHPFSEWKNE